MDNENINEQVLQAISIIAQAEIKKIHFDQTIKATIIDDTAADEGRYWCSNGSSEFFAYTMETKYKLNDKILVTIPEGNWDNQKVIISKQADEQNSPLIYSSPLAAMVDLTSNLVTGEISEGIWANDFRFNPTLPEECKNSWDMDTKDFINSLAFKYGEPFYDSGPNAIYEKGITRLGLQTQFSTWLSEFTTVAGNYGIAIELTFRDPSIAIGANSYTSIITTIPQYNKKYYKKLGNNNFQELTKSEKTELLKLTTNHTSNSKARLVFGNTEQREKENGTVVTIQSIIGFEIKPEGSDSWTSVYIYAPFNEITKYIVYDSDEFFGDVYAYESYYTNETVFDLTELQEFAIVRVKAWLYERNNFKMMDGGYVESRDLTDGFSPINPNIFMKDPYICLGVESSAFTSDRAELVSASSSVYSKSLGSGTDDLTPQQERVKNNSKEIRLKWVHRDENTGIIRLVEEEEFPEDYEVRWYRWSLGKKSCDQFSGAHWERYWGCREVENGEGDFCLTEEELDELIKKGGDFEKWARETNPTNKLNTIFIPNYNKSQEKLKVVILKTETPILTTYIVESPNTPSAEVKEETKDGETVYRLAALTDELVFTNDDEVRNEQTYLDANALSIKFLDGTNGHYFLYNRAGNVSRDSDLEIRILELVFDPDEQDISLKGAVPPNAEITWNFPSQGTMITPATSADLSAQPAKIYTFTNTPQVGYFIKKSLSRADNNNTITASAVIDGVTYQTQAQMSFGTAGTSGSAYTLDLVWNNNALDVTDPQTALLKGEVGLFDSAGNQILGDSTTITDVTTDYELQYEWAVSELVSNDEEYDFRYEDKNILYPTFKNASEATFDISVDQREDTGINDDSTYKGYYYFIDDISSLVARINNLFNGSNVASVNRNLIRINNTYNIENLNRSSSETLAYFDIEKEKFIYLKDVYNLTQQEFEKIVNGQLYRKRDTSKKITKIIKNDEFYKTIVDIFVDTNTSIYKTVLNQYKKEEDKEAFLNGIGLRLKNPTEIRASNCNLKKTLTYTNKKSMTDINNSNSVVIEESVQNERKLSDIAADYLFYLQNIKDSKENKIILSDDWLIKIQNIGDSNAISNYSYLAAVNDLINDFSSYDSEEIFNIFFETNNFYKSILEHLNEFDNLNLKTGIITYSPAPLYAIPFGSKFKYFIREEMSKTGNHQSFIFNNLINAEENVYIATTETGEAINSSNYEFEYEWPKPKIDYKSIEKIVGEEYDSDIVETDYFKTNKSAIWEGTLDKVIKDANFYERLGRIFFNESNLSQATISSRINSLKNFYNKLKSYQSENILDLRLNGNDLALILWNDENDHTKAKLLDNLVNTFSLDMPSNSITNSNQWLFNSSSYNWTPNNKNIVAQRLNNFLFNNTSINEEDDILKSLNIASSVLPVANNINSALCTMYKKVSSNDDDPSEWESFYAYLKACTSKDSQKTRYQELKNLFNSYDSNIYLNIHTFTNDNILVEFYNILLKKLGLMNLESAEDLDARNTFYHGFGMAPPIARNSRDNILQYESNIFIQENINDILIKKLELIISNKTDNDFYNSLGDNYGILSTQHLSKEILDSKFLAILYALFGMGNNQTFSTEEKHETIVRIFNVTTSSQVNNNISLVNPYADSGSGSNLIRGTLYQIANDTFLNNLIYPIKNFSINWETNNLTDITYNNKSFKLLSNQINSSTVTNWINYFSTIYSVYSSIYNNFNCYEIETSYADSMWSILYCLMIQEDKKFTENTYYSLFASIKAVTGLNFQDAIFSNYFSTITDLDLSKYYLATSSTIAGDAEIQLDSPLQSLLTAYQGKTVQYVLDNLNLDNQIVVFKKQEEIDGVVKYIYTGLPQTGSNNYGGNQKKLCMYLQNLIAYKETLNATVLPKDDFLNSGLQSITFERFLLNNNARYINIQTNTVADWNKIAKYLLTEVYPKVTEFATSGYGGTGIELNDKHIIYKGTTFGQADNANAAIWTKFKLAINDFNNKICFIKYFDNSYDLLPSYLSSVRKTASNGSGSTQMIYNQNILNTLYNILNTSGSRIVSATISSSTSLDDFVDKMFTILIKQVTNTTTTNENIINQIINSQESFENRYLNNNLSINETSHNAVYSQSNIQADYPNNIEDTSYWYLIEDSSKIYKSIFRDAFEKIKEKKILSNPNDYADDSIRLKKVKEQLHAIIQETYNKLLNSLTNVTVVQRIIDVPSNYYYQIYSMLFGAVKSATATSSAIKWKKNDNVYKLVNSSSNGAALDPVINYILLFNRFIYAEAWTDKLSYLKTSFDLILDNQKVWIKRKNSSTSIAVHDLLSGISSNPDNRVTKFKAINDLLESASKYYNASSGVSSAEISQEEAYKRLGSYLFNDTLLTWENLIKIFNYSINVSEGTFFTQVQTSIYEENSLSLLNYYYGTSLVDSEKNILYNVEKQLRNCFSTKSINGVNYFYFDSSKGQIEQFLTILEKIDVSLYKKNNKEVGYSISDFQEDCKQLWNIGTFTDNDFIISFLKQLQDLIILKQSLNDNNYLSALTSYLNNKFIVTSLENTTITKHITSQQEILDLLGNNSNLDKLQYLYGLYDILTSSQTLIKNNDSASNSVQNDYIFNYDNTGGYKAFIKVNDNFIIDPYGHYRSDEIYYYPQQTKKEKGTKIPLLYSAKGEKGREIWVYPNTSIATNSNEPLITSLMNSLSVLKVTLTNFGDYDLVAYFPIAVKRGTVRREDNTITYTPAYIQGATYIRYSSMGETEFEKNPYRIYAKELQGSDYKFVDLSQNLLYTKTGEEYSLKTFNENIYQAGWKIIHSEPQGYENNFLPTLKEDQGTEEKKKSFETTTPGITTNSYKYKLPTLRPIIVYIPEALPYGVSFYRLNNNVYDNVPIWTQSIFCYEDNYPSTTINEWNGKDIKIDNDTGEIVSSAVAAGKKESDNTFTGIMMGDWSRSDTDEALTKHTGLFGFNHGSMSFAFKDDGTGFIGKDGRGRIHFDGNKSNIYSNNWKGTEQSGMFLDIDDGVIKLYSEPGTIYAMSFSGTVIDNGEDDSGNLQVVENKSNETIGTQRFITLSSKETMYPLAIGDAPHPSQRQFRVSWDGSTYMYNAYLEDAYLKGYIYAEGGVFTGDIISYAGTIKGPRIEGSTIIGSHVEANYLEAHTQGEIAGWKINASYLTNSDGSTILYSSVSDITTSEGEVMNNPYGVSIITNRIVIKTGIGHAEIGYLTGKGISNETGETWTTNALGVQSTEKIIIKSSQDAKLESTNKSAFIYGYSDHSSSSAQIHVGGSPKGSGYGDGQVWLQCKSFIVDAPADKQFGIYARFA